MIALQNTLALCVLALGGAARPNIVLYVPDELRAESMSIYGHPFVSTPNFARLAADGTAMTQAFSTYPVCTQSRSSFLTARYTHNAAHRSLWNPLRYFEPNLLHYMKNSSYEVVWAGKNDAMDIASFNMSVSSYATGAGGNDGGFLFTDPADPRFYSFIGARPSFPPEQSGDARAVNAAIAFLRARNATAPEARTPFVLYLPLLAPHPTYGCPEPFYSMYNTSAYLDRITLRPTGLPGKPDFHSRIRMYRNITSWPDEAYWMKQLHAQYLGCVSFTDSLLGKLLDELHAVGEYNNTATFVIADHGDYAGDYGLVEKWPSGLEDVLLRVPMIAKVPGGVAGQVSHGLVQHMDVMPTILDVAGISVQHMHYGVSQLSLLMGAVGVNDTGRDAVFAEGGYSTAEPRNFEGDCTDPVRGGAGNCDPSAIYYPKAFQEWHEKLTVCRSAMVRTGEYKLILRSDPLDGDHDSEFYDLLADPLELANQYTNASYAGPVAALSKRMLQWLLQTADANPLPWTSTVGAPDEIPRSTPAPGSSWNASGAFTPPSDERREEGSVNAERGQQRGKARS